MDRDDGTPPGGISYIDVTGVGQCGVPSFWNLAGVFRPALGSKRRGTGRPESFGGHLRGPTVTPSVHLGA